MTDDTLRYPIGLFQQPERITKEIIETWIADICSFPERLKKEVLHLSVEQLDTPYRPGGWTIRQVVHHCADSHINGFIRLKLAMTEDHPTIKPYREERWAELTDTKLFTIESSLKILEGIHSRWTVLLQGLREEELERTFVHPEHGTVFTIAEHIGTYAWHGNHHLAHITTLKKRMDWA